jgi:nucleoporin SEH1
LATDNLLRVYDCLDSEHFTNVDTIDIPSLASSPRSSISPSNASFSSGLPITTKPSSSFELEGGPEFPSFLASNSIPSITYNGNSIPNSSSAGTGSKNAQGTVIKEADGGWTLSWCKDAYWGQVLAVGCGNESVVKVCSFLVLSMKIFNNSQIVQVCTLEQKNSALLTLDPCSHTSSSSSSKLPTSSTTNPTTSSQGLTTPSQPQQESQLKTPSPKQRRYAVTSVSWAPTCGRSFHTLATGSRDGRVRIWKVRAPTPQLQPTGTQFNTNNNAPAEGIELGLTRAKEKEKERWAASLVADFGEHEYVLFGVIFMKHDKRDLSRYAVSKVDWNVTG